MKINVGQQRADHRTLRRPSRRRPSLHPLNNVLTEKQSDQLKHSAVADALFDLPHQCRVRDRVEVALQVGIHHMGVALLDQFIDFAQCVFAAALRAKTVTRLLKLALEDRLDHQLQCRLHDAVFDHRNSQRAQLAAPFGNLHAPDRLWPVLPALERLLKFCQIDVLPETQTASRSAHRPRPLRRCPATLCHAALSVSGRYTLSIRLNHFPPLTPLSSAANMRSFHTVASTHVQSRPGSLRLV